jgi:hypothetical protein
MSVALQRDLFLLAIIGLVAALLVFAGQDLPLGRAARMGPGYFPLLIAVGLGLTALAVVARSIRAWRRTGRKIVVEDTADPISWRALAAIAASVIAFAVLIRPAGFIPACLVTVLACTAAQTTYGGWGERLALAGTLAAFSALLFVTGLGLPFALLPTIP